MNRRSDGPHRILIVDDEATILDGYRAILEPSGGERRDGATDPDGFWAVPEPSASAAVAVTYCAQGEPAIAAVRDARAADRPFAVAFVDRGLPPDVIGLETASQIRRVDDAVNIVIVTAHADVPPSRIVAQVPPAERLYYLSKPFDAAEVEQIAHALSHRWAAERAAVQAKDKLERDVASLRSANAELRRLKEAAELENQSKSEFLANTSHEMRTPLNAIIGFAQMIAQEEIGPINEKRYLEYANIVERSGLHLLDLTNDLLDFFKVDSDRMTINKEQVSVAEVLRDALEVVSVRAREKGLSVSMVCPSAYPLLICDRRRIFQVVVNLLTNAVKFTEPTGAIEVVTRFDPSIGFTIVITDTGIGIPADALSKVLEPFEQVSTPYTRSHEGTGLGLPISKMLVERMGGCLRLDSELGKGTQVTISFPPSLAAEPASAA